MPKTTSDIFSKRGVDSITVAKHTLDFMVQAALNFQGQIDSINASISQVRNEMTDIKRHLNGEKIKSLENNVIALINKQMTIIEKLRDENIERTFTSLTNEMTNLRYAVNQLIKHRNEPPNET